MDNTYLIKAYTRPASPDYSPFISESVHFSLISDGGEQPLFRNYGMLFPKCRFNADNGIVSAGVLDVELAKIGDVFYITGREIIRNQKKNGIYMESCQVESTGKFIRWTTKDFIRFSDPGQFDERLPDGEVAEAGSCVEISRQIAEKLLLVYRPVKFEKLCVPQDTAVKSAEDIFAIKATAVYTDASTHEKPVDWDCSAVDFHSPGSYRITGKVRRRHFPFPVEERPWGDPIITLYHGKYYFIGTDDQGGNKMFEIREANSPERLFAPDVKRAVLLDSGHSEFDTTFWAPEFHIAGGKMRIFCTLGKGDFDPQSHVMTLRDGGDMMNPADWSAPVRCVTPDGRYLSENPLGDGKNGITLDMTYFEVKERGYVAWSFRTWAGCDSGSMLMIAETAPDRPWQLLTAPKLLSRPEFGWENVDGTDNNEGPFAIVTDKKVYLAYSGGNASGDTYVIGMLTACTDAELSEPSVWTKSMRPALASNFVEGEYGCGHNGFFTDENGDTYITYHGHKTIGNSARIDGIRRVQFGMDGEPLLYLSDEDDLPASAEQVETTVVVK